jgi:hypothetical protein
MKHQSVLVTGGLAALLVVAGIGAPVAGAAPAPLSDPAAEAQVGEAQVRAAQVGAAQVEALAPQLRWGPNPAADGMDAFAGVEDDRANSHPGATHISVRGDVYRFVIHLRDRDGSDRQRQEVRGMKSGGSRVDMHRNETWLYTYSMYIPSSLRATSSFTHIFQVKHSGVASPVITTSLHRAGSRENIEMQLFGEGRAKVGTTDLAPLRNRWLDVEIEIRVADGSGGRLRWVVKDGATTKVNASRSGIDTWLGGSQAHPKWGIYRSISDKPQLQDTYLELRNLRAYRVT